MISLSNFSFEFGGRYLYKDADWHIKPKERIGLVGKNGTGKSTLLRLITGDYQLREGDMSKLKSLTIGFLNQDLLSFQSDEPIVNVAMQAFERQLFLEAEIEKLLKVVETDYSEENLHKLGEMQEEFLHSDGYDIRYKTEEILEGLGFNTADLQRPLSEFSGGWRMRVMLAKMLLMKPQLLMLDEPTNHLDLPSIEWLENYLSDYDGTVILVSHDRYFLNRMVTKIVEIANAKIYQYTGNLRRVFRAKARA
jgi:ATP-binding cassette subfamily F protein 3